MPLTRIFILTIQFVITAKSHEHVGRFALMSILSSTIPIVYIQNTRTVIDYSGKIIHTKKQGGRVGRCSAEPDTRRKPPEGAAPTADQMRSHLDLDLMATPLWVPVRLSAARGREKVKESHCQKKQKRLERVIAKRNRGRLKSTKAGESTRRNAEPLPSRGKKGQCNRGERRI